MNTHGRRKKKEPIRYFTYDAHGDYVELERPVLPLLLRSPPQQQQELLRR